MHKLVESQQSNGLLQGSRSSEHDLDGDSEEKIEGVDEGAAEVGSSFGAGVGAATEAQSSMLVSVSW